MRALDASLRPKIEQRLQITSPNTHPDDGYDAGTINSAVRYVLHGTSQEAPVQPVTTATSPQPVDPIVKTEDLTNLIGSLTRTLERLSQTLAAPQRSSPATGSNATPHGPSFPTNCHYWGELNCRIGSCPRVEEDIKTGYCKRNAQNQVTLPSGAFLPRSIAGSTMRERF
jgi:hypothetical protein